METDCGKKPARPENILEFTLRSRKSCGKLHIPEPEPLINIGKNWCISIIKNQGLKISGRDHPPELRHH
jgi:hypothetical protein